jgi:glycogen debranching enzyme
MMRDLISILDGTRFVTSDTNGDIEPSPVTPTGLFTLDTRFLSKWRLTINGQPLQTLSVDDIQYFETSFYLVPGEPTQYVDSTVSVIRHRSISGGFEETLTILNHGRTDVDLEVSLEIDSDFADIFEIKDVKPKVGRLTRSARNDGLHLCYERGSFGRETIVTSSVPAKIDDYGMAFDVHIGSQGKWETVFGVETAVRPGPGLAGDGGSIRDYLKSRRTQMRQELDQWITKAPRLVCEWDALQVTYQRSLVDLAALRYRPMEIWGAVPAAGLPWFMTLFGRDSIFTCLQVLPFTPELAQTTLQSLTHQQSTVFDDFREMEPGKMAHESRFGELSAFEDAPQSPYYGSADVTPLYVILLDEYERWTGDVELVRELEDPVRWALDWINSYGNLMGDGYIWYERRSDAGLLNQCWKDSWDSISYHDGSFPGPRRATCELQGYAYDAKMRGARLARSFWNDAEYADQLESEAADLKRRFNRDFWVEDGEFFALALDTQGRHVDALSSNIGHLLWSGIVESDKAEKVAEHLMSPQLFSGWGIRTLATGEGRYNPIGYHVGTVWPFDNSFIAWGLRRYGFDANAARVARGIIDAGQFFQGRLPEAFAGYDRGLTKFPVQYPTACSPQAWSTGASMLFLRTMLGLEPHGDRLSHDFALPEGIDHLELLEIPGRWGHCDVRTPARLPGSEARLEC